MNKKLKNKDTITSGFVDHWVFRLHYKYTFYIFVAIYMVIWHSWFQKDVMTCANKFNADVQIKQDFLNICYTYLYVPLADGTKRYLVFYRYLHFVVLFIAGLYYLLHKYVKNYDDSRIKKLLNQIEPISAKIKEEELDATVYSLVPDYIIKTLGTHEGVYWKNLIGCFLAMLIDCVTFNIINWTLQGRFLAYGYKSLPFNRDPEQYSDYMFQTFPPFAECTVGPMHEIISKREEVYGCHLTVMDLYEKVFIFIWCWLWLLIVANIYYFVQLMLFIPSWSRTKIQNSYQVPELMKVEDFEAYCKKIESTLSTLTVGDIFFLYRLQEVLPETRYFVVLCKVAHLMDPATVKHTAGEDGTDDITERKVVLDTMQEKLQIRDGGDLENKLMSRLGGDFKPQFISRLAKKGL